MAETSNPRQAADSSETHLPDNETLAAVKRLVTGPFGGMEPDVFISNTGGIGQMPHSGEYRSLSYSSVSEHGIATGSRTRIIATAEVAEALPNVKIVTNSFNRFDAGQPTMASVNKDELVSRGVDPERIETEENSFSTITQIVETIRLALNNDWENIAALTNEYHLPRMQAMYDNLETLVDDEEFQKQLKEFRDKGIQLKFICAEPILREMSPHFVAYLDEVQASPQFQETLRGEAKGLKDIEEGNYRVVLEPEVPRDK